MLWPSRNQHCRKKNSWWKINFWKFWNLIKCNKFWYFLIFHNFPKSVFQQVGNLKYFRCDFIYKFYRYTKSVEAVNELQNWDHRTFFLGNFLSLSFVWDLGNVTKIFQNEVKKFQKFWSCELQMNFFSSENIFKSIGQVEVKIWTNHHPPTTTQKKTAVFECIWKSIKII